MTGKDVPTRSLVVVKVLRHFVEHPAAKDTLHGILQWWLAPGDVQRGTEGLKEILDSLVTIGWLVETKVGSSTKLYGLNEERYEQIRTFLNGELGQT